MANKTTTTSGTEYNENERCSILPTTTQTGRARAQTRVPKARALVPCAFPGGKQVFRGGLALYNFTTVQLYNFTWISQPF